MVAFAIAVALRNVGAPAFVNRARTVAHATGIQCANTIVDIVAHAIGIFICHAFSATHAQRIELVAFTIAVALGNVGAAAFVDRTRTVANATSIQGAHAIVDVVTDAIGIGVRYAIASTYAQGVELVALAVAVTVKDSFPTAHTAFVQHIAIAIAVAVRDACTTAHTALVQLQA